MFSKKEYVESMFDGIARRYDLLNHLLSCNIDRKWRRMAAMQTAYYKPQSVLDAATGTADMAIALSKCGIPKIVGIDISQKMIDEGQKKILRMHLDNLICLQIGDGEKLPFANDSFDAATISFGIRNYENRKLGFTEILRVLRPKGHLVMLEFSMPQNKVCRWLYNIYFGRILPYIGRSISHHKNAYDYLPQSVAKFPSPNDLRTEILDAGFANVQQQSLSCGIVHLYNAQKNNYV